MLSRIAFEITVEFLAYFCLVAGISGSILFFLMLNNLKFLRRLGQIFNTVYSVKKMENSVNRTMGESLSYILLLHPGIFGAFLCMVSVLLISVFAFKIDAEKFVNIFHVQQNVKVLFLMGIQSFQWLMGISLSFVFIYGVLLIFKQKTAMGMVKKFDRWYRFDESIENSLDRTVSKDIDTISFLLHRHVGMVGLILSIILTIIALLDILFVI